MLFVALDAVLVVVLVLVVVSVFSVLLGDVRGKAIAAVAAISLPLVMPLLCLFSSLVCFCCSNCCRF